MAQQVKVCKLCLMMVVRVSPTQQTNVRGCISEATVLTHIYDLNMWDQKDQEFKLSSASSWFKGHPVLYENLPQKINKCYSLSNTVPALYSSSSPHVLNDHL